MTDFMKQAGISAYAQHRGGDPELLVLAVWKAMKEAKQKEALEKYWALYPDAGQHHE